MGDFDKAFAHVFRLEGGYVNDPDDPGGETKYGISRRQYPDHNIRDLTLDEAKQIYRADYWTGPNISAIEDQDVAEEVFEAGVNMGPARAVSMLQRALNALGASLVVDGILGRRTAAETNEATARGDGRDLLVLLNGLQLYRYIDRASRSAPARKFLRGWMQRVDLVYDKKRG